MLGGIIGALFTAWFLNLFGFYEGIFTNFVAHFINFTPDIYFYYGSFAFIGLVSGALSSAFKD